MPVAQAPGAWPKSPYFPSLHPSPAASDSSRDLLTTALALALLPAPGKTACIAWGCFVKKTLVNLMWASFAGYAVCNNFCSPRTQSHWKGTLRLWSPLWVSRSGL